MEFFKNNKFLIIFILFLSACGYFFLYIQEEKNKKNLIEIDTMQIEESVSKEEEIIEEVRQIFVDVAGEVLNPGVYSLNEGSRVNDLIIAAGGVTKDANLANVNLAYVLSDGIKITIPNMKDNLSKNIMQSGLVNTNISNGIVNINQADINELMNLSGIGESIAQNIIEYREQNGKFKKKEDIKNVSGIGESKYNKIKDKISV